jgi:hypothetical protein
MANIKWTGAAGDGNWDNMANWRPQQVPGAGDTVVIAPAAAALIDLGVADAAANLTTSSLVTLAVGNNHDFTIGTGASALFSNGGTLQLNAGADAATLKLGATHVTLTGGGVVALDGSGLASITDGGTPTTLTNLNNTIAGAGAIQSYGALTVVNDGIIDAAGGALVVGGTGGVINNKMLEASSGGTLLLGLAIANAGTIELAGGNAELGTTITGGTITGTGTLVVASIHQLDSDSGTLSGGAKGLTLDAATAVQSAGLYLRGAIANASTIALDANSRLTLAANVTLSGGGTLTLDGGTASASAANLTFTNVNNTISGDGLINGGHLNFVNKGTVDANAAGNLIFSSPIAVTNTDLMEATGAGGLYLGDTIDNKGGTLSAAGGNINLGGDIEGGTLSGTGSLVIAGFSQLDSDSGNLDGTTFGAITNDTTVAVSSASLYAGGVINNQAGSIALANDSTLFLGTSGHGGNLQINGGTLDVGAGCTVSSQVVGSRLINQGGTITGSGTIDGGFAYQQVTLVNNGTIIGGLTIEGELINNSAVIASTGTTLTLASVVTGTGTLLIQSGGVLQITAPGDVGNLITGPGELLVDADTNYYNNHIDNVGIIAIQNGFTFTTNGQVLGQVIDNGVLAVTTGTLTLRDLISGTGTYQAGSGSTLNINGGGELAGTIAGAGVVDISNTMTLGNGASLAGTNMVETANMTVGLNSAAQISAGATLSLAEAAGHDIAIGADSGATFTNNGNLAATGAGNAAIYANFTNAGTVLASAGKLSFLGTLTNDGTITASGGAVALRDLVSGTGTLQVGGTGSLTLERGAAIGQTVDFLAASGLLNLSNPIDFAGTIANFGGADQIDLLNAPETGYSFSGGVLSVTNGGATVAKLHFSGVGGGQLIVGGDGHGGTLITFG